MITYSALNFKEINLLLAELSLFGARIDDFHQPRPDRLIMQVFHKGKKIFLLFSMSQKSCCFYLYTGDIIKSGPPQRFVSFLRAHACNGRIANIDHVLNERILKIVIERGQKQSLLWVRLWASAPNIIFTDMQGVIGDALFRRPKKNEISGGMYNPEEEFKKDPPKTRDNDQFYVRDFVGKGTFHERVENYFEHARKDSLADNLKERLISQLDAESIYLSRSLETFSRMILEKSDYERYKQFGDLVMGNLSKIKKGDAWFQGTDFFNADARIEIILDKDLSPVENAEKYYRLYKKAKATIARLTADSREYEERRRMIADKKRHLLSIDDPAKLGDISKKMFPQTVRATSKAPGLRFSSQGFVIHVGRTAQENEELFRRYIRGNDWWMHARDFPGASVFIKAIKGKSIPLKVLLDAGNLALFYSKGKNSGKGDLYYTQVKYLKKAHGGKPGLFIPTREKNIAVSIDRKRIERLKDDSTNI